MMRLLRKLQVPVLLFCLCSFLIPTTSFAIPTKVKFADIEDAREVFVNNKKYYCGVVDGKTYPFFAKLNKKKQVKVGTKVLGKQLKKLKKKIKAGQGNLKKLRKQKKKKAQLKKALIKSCGIGRNLLKEFTGNVSEDMIRYLLRKAGVGVSQADFSRLNAVRSQGISQVVNRFAEKVPEASGFDDMYLDLLDGDDENGINLDDQSFRGIEMALLYAQLHGKNPLYERLTKWLMSLVTVGRDVLDNDEAHIMSEYINGSATMDGLRTLALNPNMKEVLLDTQASAMMLIYLDGTNNIQSAPNQNHAREILELFSTGVQDLAGNAIYTETGDIPALSLAMTGYRVSGGNAGYSPFDQYTGSVTLFEGTDRACTVSGGGLSKIERVVDCIFQSQGDNIANFYAKNLLDEFYGDPSPELIKALGAVILNNNFNILPALLALFKSEIFYEDVIQNTVPKDPMQFVAEVIRTLGIPMHISDAQDWVNTLGQEITFPPDVFWWSKDTWTGSSVALESINFLQELINSDFSDEGWYIEDLLPSNNATPLQLVRHVAGQTGVPLTPNIEALLVDFMNTRLNGDEREEDLFDITNPTHVRQRFGGLYVILYNSIPGRLG